VEAPPQWRVGLGCRLGGRAASVWEGRGAPEPTAAQGCSLRAWPGCGGAPRRPRGSLPPSRSGRSLTFPDGLARSGAPGVPQLLMAGVCDQICFGPGRRVQERTLNAAGTWRGCPPSRSPRDPACLGILLGCPGHSLLLWVSASQAILASSRGNVLQAPITGFVNL
jgi:hypothetical protein